MKKILYLLLTLAVFSFASCKTDVPDDNNSIPNVDISKYDKEDCYEFPRGTKALEIITCVKSVVGEENYGKETPINGSYSVVYSHKNPEEISNEIKVDYKIVKAKVYNVHHEASNSFFVTLYSDKPGMYWENNKWNKYEKNMTITLEYRWQMHNTNVWTNTPCPYTIKVLKNTK